MKRLDITFRRKKRDCKESRYVILGAGCAGLSLAWHMLDAGIKGSILLVDRRNNYGHDRTWCYWGVEPTPFDDLADARWNSWKVISAEGGQAVGNSARYPYLHLRSERFYARILERLSASPQVTLLLDQPVEDCEERDDDVLIRTGAGEIAADQVFVSLGEPPPKVAGADGMQPWVQHFRGQRIETCRPVFSPDRLTLMDHRVSQADGPHFIYLLPFSPTAALVENTYFFPAEIPPTRHREEIADYLSRVYRLGPREYEVLAEESGIIPMERRRSLPSPGGRIHRIGIAGGAARPATGYAFLRIQRQARRIARDLSSGALSSVTSTDFGSRKYDIFDTMLMRALQRHPERAPAFFTTLFQEASPETVVRFLTERSNVMDDLQIVRAVFRPEFIRMFWERPQELPRPHGFAYTGARVHSA